MYKYIILRLDDGWQTGEIIKFGFKMLGNEGLCRQNIRRRCDDKTAFLGKLVIKARFVYLSAL